MIGLLHNPRIVRTWSDRSCLTGESMYETEDGRVWRTSRGGELGTGDQRAMIRDGAMVPLPLPRSLPAAAQEREPNRAERRAALSSRKRPGWRRP